MAKLIDDSGFTKIIKKNTNGKKLVHLSCDQCKFTCSHKIDLQNHIKQNHEKLFTNNIYNLLNKESIHNESINNGSNINADLGKMITHEKLTRQLTCDQCEFICVCKVSMDNHSKDHEFYLNMKCDLNKSEDFLHSTLITNEDITIDNLVKIINFCERGVCF